MSGTGICLALPVLTSRQLVSVNLVSAVGESLTCARHTVTSESGLSSSQSSLELDDEELLLELPLLRLGTDGATTTEVGDHIVKSAVGAPRKFPKTQKDKTQPFNVIRRMLIKHSKYGGLVSVYDVSPVTKRTVYMDSKIFWLTSSCSVEQ